MNKIYGNDNKLTIEGDEEGVENKRQETCGGNEGKGESGCVVGRKSDENGVGGKSGSGGKRKRGERSSGERSSGERSCGERSSGERGRVSVRGKGVLKEKLILITSGIATGFANGFFGGGGGMITVPALAKILKYEEKKAHATALLVILPISIFSSISYVVKGSIDWKIAGFVAIGVVVGGIIGAVFLKKISNKVLTYLFALIMIAVGVKMFL